MSSNETCEFRHKESRPVKREQVGEKNRVEHVVCVRVNVCVCACLRACVHTYVRARTPVQLLTHNMKTTAGSTNKLQCSTLTTVFKQNHLFEGLSSGAV